MIAYDGPSYDVRIDIVDHMLFAYKKYRVDMKKDIDDGGYFYISLMLDVRYGLGNWSRNSFVLSFLREEMDKFIKYCEEFSKTTLYVSRTNYAFINKVLDAYENIETKSLELFEKKPNDLEDHEKIFLKWQLI